jgi:GT2 family glycosyltransferase
MAHQPSVHVGVPVWRGAAFVGETLRSVLAQQGVDLRVSVSIDGGHEETEAACAEFLGDPRVRLVVQDKRLGWAGNVNMVLEAGWNSGAGFFCIQPHDDLMEPGYLTALHAAAALHPQAAVTFSDIVAFGAPHGVIAQDSVVGTPLQRQLILLRDHFNGVAFRGLIRRALFASVPLLKTNDCANFAADTVFMARLASAGDLIRVPAPLYLKRYHAANTHTAWNHWDSALKVRAWLRHCADMFEEARPVAFAAGHEAMALEAARERLLQLPPRTLAFPGLVAGLSPLERSALEARFGRAVGAASGLRAIV